MKKKNKLCGTGFSKGSFKRMVEVNRGYNKSIDRFSEIVERTRKIKEELSEIPILSIAPSWSIRTLNCLNRAKIKTLGDLGKYSLGTKRYDFDNLLSFRNFGKKSLQELKDKLSQYLFSILFKCPK